MPLSLLTAVQGSNPSQLHLLQGAASHASSPLRPFEPMLGTYRT